MGADDQDSNSNLLDGGRYKLIRRLGEGGMGKVFLAMDHELNSQVVIKVPHKLLLRDKTFAARFQREIRSLQKLKHPHIVPILDVGDQRGLPYLVMPFLSGGSLEARLKDGPMDEESLKHWLPAIARALDFVHEKGFIHRDVKPANILFNSEGKVFLSDFGIAKTVGSTASSETTTGQLTGTGLAMGTPDYMAPELVMSLTADVRADQYALAVTVYQALSGRLPFVAETPGAVMVLHSTAKAPSLMSSGVAISAPANAAVARALEKVPENRFGSCNDFSLSVLSLADSEFLFPVSRTDSALPTSSQRKTTVSNLDLKVASVTANRKESSDWHRNNNSGRRLAFVVTIVMVLLGALFLKPHFQTESSNEPGRVVSPDPMTGAAETLASVRKPTVPNGMRPGEPPVPELSIEPIPLQLVDEQTALNLVIRTTVPLSVNHRLELDQSAPKGVIIDPGTGALTWIPLEAQGPREYSFRVQVVDQIPDKIVCAAPVRIVVREVKSPPVIRPEARFDATRGSG